MTATAPAPAPSPPTLTPPSTSATEPRRPSPARPRALAVAVGLCTLTAALLGASNVRRSIWYDEAFTLVMSRLDPTTFWRTSWDSEMNMVGHHLLLRFSGLTESLLQARLVSVAVTAATVPLLFVLGARLFGARAGVAAATLAAVHPAMVEYSAEARAYALAAFLVTACALALTEAVLTGRWWAWLAAPVLGAAAVYSHLFAAFALAAFGLSLLAVRPAHGPQWGHRMVSAALGGVLLVPMAQFLTGSPGTQQLDWIANEPPDAVNRTLWFFSGSMDARLTAALVVLLCVGAVAWLRRLALDGRAVRSWRYLLVTAWAAFPLIAAASIHTFRPILVPRYVLVSVPAIALLAGAFIGALSSRRMQWAVGAGLAALLLVGSLDVVRSPERHQWDALARHVADHGRPSDGIAIVPAHERIALEHYLIRHSASTLPLPLSPRSSWGTMPLFRLDSPESGRVPPYRDRVWLVLATARPETDPQVAEIIGQLSVYPRVSGASFGELTLYLYER